MYERWTEINLNYRMYDENNEETLITNKVHTAQLTREANFMTLPLGFKEDTLISLL